MHEKPSLIDSPLQVISNGRWHTTWFLMVEELCPLKDEALKYGQEAFGSKIKKLQVGPKVK
jgi:hypothetical protein